MSWLGGNGGARKSGIITVLDIGSSKVCCIIARLKPCAPSEVLRGRTHQIQVMGIGHQKSRGVKSGVIVDLALAEQAIRLAVDAAERMSGLTVESLLISVSAGRIRSKVSSASIELGGHAVDDADIKRVLGAGAKQALRAEREVLHSLPVGFSLDTERGVRDPRGMVGELLGVDMHVLTADAAPLRNLELCVNRAHLSVERMVATPYASGLAALPCDHACNRHVGRCVGDNPHRQIRWRLSGPARIGLGLEHRSLLGCCRACDMSPRCRLLGGPRRAFVLRHRAGDDGCEAVGKFDDGPLGNRDVVGSENGSGWIGNDALGNCDAKISQLLRGEHFEPDAAIFSDLLGHVHAHLNIFHDGRHVLGIARRNDVAVGVEWTDHVAVAIKLSHDCRDGVRSDDLDRLGPVILACPHVGVRRDDLIMAAFRGAISERVNQIHCHLQLTAAMPVVFVSRDTVMPVCVDG